METVLEMFKIDLGISHNKRDAYFTNYLQAQQNELERKGIALNFDKVEDIMLLSDYAAWNYRKRSEDMPLANNLLYRLRNRQIQKRAEAVEQ